MSEIKGLPSELRRAAKTTEEIADIFVRTAGEKNQREVFELKWVPAGLVGEEMHRVKERIGLLRNEFCSQEPSDDGQGITCDGLPDRERCRECLLIDKFEEALGK